MWLNFRTGGFWIQNALTLEPRHTRAYTGEGVPRLAPENSGNRLASGEVTTVKSFVFLRPVWLVSPDTRLPAPLTAPSGEGLELAARAPSLMLP